MVCYAMLCYPMVWNGKNGMLWDFNAMQWDFYAMLGYMVYIVKDTHSATVVVPAAHTDFIPTQHLLPV